MLAFVFCGTQLGMGVIRKETKEIGGVVYTTETYTWSEGVDIYAQVGSALPDAVLSLIMLPLSSALEKQRKRASVSGEAGEDGEALDVDPGIAGSIQDLLIMIESPNIMAKVAGEVMRASADIPGGLAALMKRVLFKTTANPIQLASAGDGHQAMKGGEANLAAHIDTHFSGGHRGIMDSIGVCVWVLRENFAGP